MKHLLALTLLVIIVTGEDDKLDASMIQAITAKGREIQKLFDVNCDGLNDTSFSRMMNARNREEHSHKL